MRRYNKERSSNTTNDRERSYRPQNAPGRERYNSDPQRDNAGRFRAADKPKDDTRKPNTGNWKPNQRFQSGGNGNAAAAGDGKPGRKRNCRVQMPDGRICNGPYWDRECKYYIERNPGRTYMAWEPISEEEYERIQDDYFAPYHESDEYSETVQESTPEERLSSESSDSKN